jgi:hypothetical protein
VLAAILSYRKQKTPILRSYLNEAYHGYGIKGCEQASLIIFGAQAAELQGDAAAFVASLLVYPLPKQVQEEPELNEMLPLGDVEKYIEACAKVAPNWSRNISRQSRYGLALLRKAKQS